MRTPAAALLLALALSSCGGSAPPAGAARTEGYIGSALDALAKNPIRADEPGKDLLLHENADHTVRLVQLNAVILPHYHKDHDEVVHILKGAGTFYLNETPREVQPGDVIVIPRYAVHAFRNKGPEPTAALSIFTPRFDPADRFTLTSKPKEEPAK